MWIFNHNDKEYMRGDIFRSMIATKWNSFSYRVVVDRENIKEGSIFIESINEEDYKKLFEFIIKDIKEIDYNIVVEGF